MGWSRLSIAIARFGPAMRRRPSGGGDQPDGAVAGERPRQRESALPRSGNRRTRRPAASAASKDTRQGPVRRQRHRTTWPLRRARCARARADAGRIDARSLRDDEHSSPLVSRLVERWRRRPVNVRFDRDRKEDDSRAHARSLSNVAVRSNLAFDPCNRRVGLPRPRKQELAA